MKSREQYKPKTIPSYVDIDSETYHASAGISSSGLKLMARSPAHYWARYVDPDREPQEDTPALVLGKQIHTAVLEPGKYLSRYYPLPEKYNRSTKAGKEEHAFHEEKAKAAGQQLISPDSHEICQKIAEGVRSHPSASFLFDLPGLVEKSFYWTDPETGVLCKVRPDKLVKFNDKLVILDLKSTSDASHRAFQRDAFNYGYHISAEFYRQGVAAVSGQEIGAFIFAAYEKESPFACAFFDADSEMLAHAQKEIKTLLRQYADCLAADEWPGYPEDIQPLSLPGWVKAA